MIVLSLYGKNLNEAEKKKWNIKPWAKDSCYRVQGLCNSLQLLRGNNNKSRRSESEYAELYWKYVFLRRAIVCCCYVARYSFVFFTYVPLVYMQIQMCVSDNEWSIYSFAYTNAHATFSSCKCHVYMCEFVLGCERIWRKQHNNVFHEEEERCRHHRCIVIVIVVDVAVVVVNEWHNFNQ